MLYRKQNLSLCRLFLERMKGLEPCGCRKFGFACNQAVSAEGVSFEFLLTLVSCESAPALIVARGRETRNRTSARPRPQRTVERLERASLAAAKPPARRAGTPDL